MDANVREEELLRVERDPVRNADVAHRRARTRGTDCLHDRLRGADALEHRVRADSVGQLLHASDAVVAALGHDVRRAELAGELLPRRVTAHRDDPFGTELPGGE